MSVIFVKSIEGEIKASLLPPNLSKYKRLSISSRVEFETSLKLFSLIPFVPHLPSPIWNFAKLLSSLTTSQFDKPPSLKLCEKRSFISASSAETYTASFSTKESSPTLFLTCKETFL